MLSQDTLRALKENKPVASNTLTLEAQATLVRAKAVISSTTDISEVEQKAKEKGCDILELNPIEGVDTSALLQRGFNLCPNKVTYKLIVPKTDEEYLSKLSRNKRKAISSAQRQCAVEGITFKIEEPISKETFLSWEKIYDSNITSKRIGFKRISIDRFLLFEPRSTGVFAYKNNELIGGILLTKKRFIYRLAPKEKISISLSSSIREYFKLGINEVLNLEAIKLARKLGFEFLERGFDTNLYGHYLSPGLHLFKKSLGFRIAPKAKYGFAFTKILSFEKLQDNVFFVSVGERGVEGHLYFKEKVPNIKEYESEYLSKLTVYQVQNNTPKIYQVIEEKSEV